MVYTIAAFVFAALGTWFIISGNVAGAALLVIAAVLVTLALGQRRRRRSLAQPGESTSG